MNNQNQSALEPTGSLHPVVRRQPALAASAGSTEIRQRLDRAIFFLSQANRSSMSWETHNQIEKAMIDVGWVRDRIP